MHSLVEALAYIRRSLSLAAILAQSHYLIGRLEGMGIGISVVLGRRKEALDLERRWDTERKAVA